MEMKHKTVSVWKPEMHKGFFISAGSKQRIYAL